jgi:hypothetical protein
LSKADYETWVTRRGRRHGRPYAERKPLNVPWELARGNYGALSNLQLREAINDLAAEAERRDLPATQQRSAYDPARSQVRKPSA